MILSIDYLCMGHTTHAEEEKLIAKSQRMVGIEI